MATSPSSASHSQPTSSSLCNSAASLSLSPSCIEMVRATVVTALLCCGIQKSTLGLGFGHSFQFMSGQWSSPQKTCTMIPLNPMATLFNFIHSASGLEWLMRPWSDLKFPPPPLSKGADRPTRSQSKGGEGGADNVQTSFF